MLHTEKLVRQTQKYWEKRFNEKIPEETVNVYLDSLGGLYLAFSEISRDKN